MFGNLNKLTFLKKCAKAPAKANNSIIAPIFHNVVVTAQLNCKLDLKKITYESENVEYNPKKFSGLVMRLKEPRTTALVHPSGKIICVGAKNVEDAHVAARKYARTIQKVGYVVKFSNFKVRNMVATYSVGFRIRLEGLSEELGSSGSYLPEAFVGINYKMSSPKVAMFILPNGYIVMFGVTDTKDVQEAFDIIFPVVKKYAIRKQNLKG